MRDVKLRHTKVAHFTHGIEYIAIVGARLPRPTPTPTGYITAPCGLTNPQVLGLWLGYVYPSRAVIVQVRKPVPTRMFIGCRERRSAFPTKAMRSGKMPDPRGVDVYTKNSCWLPQRVRQPTAISSECIARLLQNDHFTGP